MESLNIKKNAILQSNTLLNLLKWVNEKEQEENEGRNEYKN